MLNHDPNRSRWLRGSSCLQAYAFTVNYTGCKVSVQYCAKVRGALSFIAMVKVGGTGAKAVLPGMVRRPTTDYERIVGGRICLLLPVRESATGGI